MIIFMDSSGHGIGPRVIARQVGVQQALAGAAPSRRELGYVIDTSVFALPKTLLMIRGLSAYART